MQDFNKFAVKTLLQNRENWVAVQKVCSRGAGGRSLLESKEKRKQGEWLVILIHTIVLKRGKKIIFYVASDH